MSYEDFVMRTVRQVRVARSLDEAFRTPDYGYAVWHYQAPTSKYVKAFAPAAVLIAILVVMFAAPSVITNLIENVK